MSVKAQGITSRAGIKRTPPTPNSKTSKRRANKAKHMQSTKGMH